MSEISPLSAFKYKTATYNKLLTLIILPAQHDLLVLLLCTHIAAQNRQNTYIEFSCQD